MKITKITILTAALLSVGIGGIAPAAFAHGDGPAPAKPAPAPDAATVASFEGAAKIWADVLTGRQELETTVTAKKWGEVHEAAFNLRDDVRLLPAQSKALEEKHQTRLSGYVKEVDALAEQLDAAGDGGNGAQVEKLQKSLHKVLGQIAKLYPRGVLPSGAAGHTANGHPEGHK